MTYRPLVMGVLNVTPDSFSDGGCYLDLPRAIAHAEHLVEEGADIIDIGGESTRPGAKPISLAEEQDRVLRVVESIRSFPVTLSIDTRHYETALEATARGASIINDISGGADMRMAGLLKGTDSILILMHMQNEPMNMQANPCYPSGVVKEVGSFLRSRVAAYQEAGARKDQLWVDPGIGFGKTRDHNLHLLHSLSDLCGIGDRLVIGTSRKRFLSLLLNEANAPFEQREPGTVASSLYALQAGASVFRVHRVAEMKRAITTWEAIQNAR